MAQLEVSESQAFLRAAADTLLAKGAARPPPPAQEPASPRLAAVSTPVSPPRSPPASASPPLTPKSALTEMLRRTSMDGGAGSPGAGRSPSRSPAGAGQQNGGVLMQPASQ